MRAELEETRRELKRKPPRASARRGRWRRRRAENGFNLIVQAVEGLDGDALLDLSDRFKQRHSPAAVVLGGVADGKVTLIANFDDERGGQGQRGRRRQGRRARSSAAEAAAGDDGAGRRKGSGQALGRACRSGETDPRRHLTKETNDRCLSVLALVALLAALAAVTPGAARADDAAVAASVTKWSLRITPKAQALSTKISANTTPAELLVFLQSFTKVGRQGAAAIASTKPATAKGTKLKNLAKRSFVNFGNAGALLIKAVQMLKAGKTEAEVTPVVNQAVTLANTGSTQLKQAAKLIPTVAR